jgi:hypothetical protein
MLRLLWKDCESAQEICGVGVELEVEVGIFPVACDKVGHVVSRCLKPI